MHIQPCLRDSSRFRPFTRARSMKRQYLHKPLDSPAIAMDRKAHRVAFDSLPIELQDEIFFSCIPPFPRFSINEAPIVLAQVCRTWRSIVLSTPRLWSSFGVEIQGSGASGLLYDAHLMHRMKLWLERSSLCPLSIQLVHNPIGRVSEDRSAQFLAILVPEARRWRNAHFTLPAATIVQLQPFPPNSFPALQSLTLEVTGVRPTLFDPPLDISAISIPWRQLTSLDLQLEPSNLFTLNEGLDILSKTVNLKRCKLYLKCTWNHLNIEQDKLSLPALEDLQLILHDSNTASTSANPGVLDPEACLARFLGLLCLPKLRKLHLGWLVNRDMGLWSAAHPDFLAFLRASSETLRELTLTYFPIAENELLEYLAEVPELTHLDLRFALNEGANDPITNQLLVAFTIPSFAVSTGIARRRQTQTEAPLLPRLQHINLQCHGSHYANSTLLSLIQSRWKLNQTDGARRLLRSFRLLSMKAVPSEVDKNVNVWHEEGLDIDIQCLVVR